MFSLQPFFAMVSAFIYVGIVYICVRKEKKSIKLSVTISAGVLQGVFLFLWLRQSVYFMTTSNVGFPAYERFAQFVEIAYIVLAIPFVIVLLRYIIKIIVRHIQSYWLRGIVISVYAGALGGIVYLGQLVFLILYYGLAP
ncbi:hypothetical protein [Marinilactibacillus sp. Marseille-P9653]|uniref:hypothetical protein n=1 Tax=Marinilactibacillus sp. Marseille-P9653 TaxID=2866583 RepID=UPI001CE43294|nr:hypothetical protein [Marinilactibacillus sp. Marseille-P9653]